MKTTNHAKAIRNGLFLVLVCVGILQLMYGLRIQIKALGLVVAMTGLILQSLDNKCDCEVKLIDKVMTGFSLSIILVTCLVAGSLVITHTIEPISGTTKVSQEYATKHANKITP